MENNEVEIKVDLKRREELRRLHTATHILNYSSRKILGNHIWQNGSNLKNEFGVLDITHYENLTETQIFKIERLVNKIIYENKKVSIEELERSEAEKKYGFILYQGGAIPMKKLRIVSILDSDVEACGGIHMMTTCGIGIFKIVDSQKIQDGVIRLKFVVNDYAFKFVEEKEKLLNNVKNVFNVDETSLEKTSLKFFEGWKNQKKEIENLKEQLKILLIETILNSDKEQLEIKQNFDVGFLIEIFNSINNKKKSFKLITPKIIITTQNLEIKDFKKKILKDKFIIFIL